MAAGLRIFSIVTSLLLFCQRTGCARAHTRYFSAKTLVVAAPQLVADSPFSARHSRICFKRPAIDVLGAFWSPCSDRPEQE
jgi:hypothetical protein